MSFVVQIVHKLLECSRTIRYLRLLHIVSQRYRRRLWVGAQSKFPKYLRNAQAFVSIYHLFPLPIFLFAPNIFEKSTPVCRVPTLKNAGHLWTPQQKQFKPISDFAVSQHNVKDKFTMPDSQCFRQSPNRERLLALHPDLEFWTELIANNGNTDKFGRSVRFQGCKASFWALKETLKAVIVIGLSETQNLMCSTSGATRGSRGAIAPPPAQHLGGAKFH